MLPIGGLKDKVLAAHRADIFTVIIPKENRKDLKDIPKKVLKVMKIIAVEHMDEVLRAALTLERPDTFLHEPSRAVDWRQEPAKRGRRCARSCCTAARRDRRRHALDRDRIHREPVSRGVQRFLL